MDVTGTFGPAVAFFAGMVSFLSPCVLPLVPGYVAWVAGTDLATARAERWRALRLAAFFVLGFGLVFVLLGLGATAVGGLLRRPRLGQRLHGAAQHRHLGAQVLEGLCRVAVVFVIVAHLPCVSRLVVVRGPRPAPCVLSLPR